MKVNASGFARKLPLFFVLAALLGCLCLPVGAAQADMLQIQDEDVPLTVRVLEPQSSGAVVYSGGGATIDASNADQGYVMVRYSGNNSKIKVRVVYNGRTDYKYDLDANGNYEVFPLSCGDGSYMIGVYTNISGSSYAEALTKTINVRLSNPMLPFLYPSQYVNFNSGSRAVAKSSELVRGASDDLAAISNIYNYVIGNVSYDTGKAQKVAEGKMTGYLPNVDSILSSGRGICFDYAALMAAMLRAQQIPTRMEIGYVSGGAYHAWISTYVTDVGWVNGVIQFDGKNWKLMDPTFAASGKGSSEIMKYIGNGSNYRTQYVY